ncbi:MAG: D-alanyl-D-alanine carboxypeptidase, partial [uncultured Solirubrobacteraceae bacterium]
PAAGRRDAAGDGRRRRGGRRGRGGRARAAAGHAPGRRAVPAARGARRRHERPVGQLLRGDARQGARRPLRRRRHDRRRPGGPAHRAALPRRDRPAPGGRVGPVARQPHVRAGARRAPGRHAGLPGRPRVHRLARPPRALRDAAQAHARHGGAALPVQDGDPARGERAVGLLRDRLGPDARLRDPLQRGLQPRGQAGRGPDRPGARGLLGL